MKTITMLFLFTIIVNKCLVENSECAVQQRASEDHPATIVAQVPDADALAYNNATKLVRGQDGDLHLVFHDQGEVYYCISTNKGNNWSAPLNVSNTAGWTAFPALAIDSANRKHFLWEDDSSPYDLNVVDGKKRIWYKNFIDAASSVARYPYVIGEAVGDVQTPSIAVRDEKTVTAAWAAYTGVRLGWEINVSTGTMTGSGLLALYDWTYPSFPGEALGIGSSFFPAITTLGKVTDVAWQELDAFNDNVCFFKYNRGNTWSSPQLLSNAAIPSFLAQYDVPAVILSQDTTAFFGFGVDFAAQSPVFDVFAVSHKNSDSLEFGDGVNVSNTAERERSATFAITRGNELVLAWQTIKSNSGIICFSKAQLNGYDKTWSAPLCVSDESANARNPQVVAITPDTLLFVWLQGNSAPFEIVAKRYPPLITKIEIVEETTSDSRLPINASIYPNPLNNSTNFEITLKNSGLLSTKIYNIQGQLVKSIIEQQVSSGVFRYSWDAKDGQGMPVPNGVYVAVFQLGSNRTIKRIVVLKQ